MVLDVRDDDEFAEAHIPGSINLPYGELPDRQASSRVTGRSPLSAAAASAAASPRRSSSGRASSGSWHVANGGVGTWRRDGRPIESG